MARNMIAANQAIFASLDRYCAERGDPIANAGAARWIATDPGERKLLKEAEVISYLSFGPRRCISRIDHATNSYFCTFGFEYLCTAPGLAEIDVGNALLTTLLAELKPRPRAIPAQVRDIVEVHDKTVSGYEGHDGQLISQLFPPVRALISSEPIPREETWRIFFLISLIECRACETWIDAQFAENLRCLCELDLLKLPYKMLCRSIFDADPGTMFLALYRCLEAIYAYSSSVKVIAALKLEIDWGEMAVVLEDRLGWHPREESSLRALLKHSIAQDMDSLLCALGAKSASDNIKQQCAREIYRLRNALVHYRPSQYDIDTTSIDWNRLCNAMTGLICDIYYEVFARVLTNPQ
jgi:hypothetical protein